MASTHPKLIVLLAAVVRAPQKGDHISSAALAQQSDGDYCNPSRRAEPISGREHVLDELRD